MKVRFPFFLFAFHFLKPSLNFRPIRPNLVAVDAETLRDIGTWERLFHVLDAVGESRAFVGGERNDGLAFQVVGVVLEEGEHHLRIGSPPHGTADEDGVVGREVDVALVLRQFAILRLFLGQFDERHIGHAVVLVGDDFKLLDRMNFTSLSYFSRYCTKHLGQSPSEYRQSLQPK